jgi:aminomethyltransferase
MALGITMTGYEALREGAALLNLEGRGILFATGEDRARLLHAMTTNHVQQMQAGELCYAFFLNAQGRIQADAQIVALEEAILIDTEPERREFLLAYLDRYIIADDVTLDDQSDQWAVVAVEGPGSGDVMRAIGIDALPGAGHWRRWESWMVAAATVTGAPGYRLYVPAVEKQAVRERLAKAGAVEASAEEAHVVRLERARPRYGEDLSDSHIPHETRLMHALHFNKGCYLGQEIVERVRSRGHVNRLLVQLFVDGEHVPPRSARIRAGGVDVGEITSSAYSKGLGKGVALGYVRAEYGAGGRELEADGARAVVSEQVPA